MRRFLTFFSIILMLLLPISTFSENIRTSPAGGNIYEKNYFEYFYELDDKISELEKENQLLREKYGVFNTNTETYTEILSQSRLIADDKENAYNTALNSIKWWFWIIGIIFVVIISIFSFLGYKEWKGIKKNIQDSVQKLFNDSLEQERSLLVETTAGLEDRVSELEDKKQKSNSRNRANHKENINSDKFPE